MTDASPDDKTTEIKGERIAKRLARAGLCSRRDAERWIADGRVSVDGKVLTTPAVTVTADSLIVVDGKPLPDADRSRLWRYHKPSGLVTSHKDPQGRPTVFERLPEDMPRVISIGRLDLNSEGLLLLTNDGELARRLELPSTGWVRRYRARVHGTPNVAQLAELERGVTVDGVSYGPIKALLDRQQGSNAWLTVSLKEGKNREIRKVMEYLGWTVSRLIRIAYGPFQLGLLEEGAVDEVPPRVIKEQLGDKGAAKQIGDKSAVKRDGAAGGRDTAAKPQIKARRTPHENRRRPS
ncbi:pseudouridine synthase [Telmatospirillum sp.]|uniref:pseudouridine synthase n=1 Tax=Telmatospirillum sp. TaxID=2079197 RepID=UPI00283E9807|nr:pseudouridine synthase [Telmatospirillum sp.]MDR3435585.1 pseudouridine synthase [Telmatospirillum sp.]